VAIRASERSVLLINTYFVSVPHCHERLARRQPLERDIVSAGGAKVCCADFAPLQTPKTIFEFYVREGTRAIYIHNDMHIIDKSKPKRWWWTVMSVYYLISWFRNQHLWGDANALLHKYFVREHANFCFLEFNWTPLTRSCVTNWKTYVASWSHQSDMKNLEAHMIMN
jgi:hypothetical protein